MGNQKDDAKGKMITAGIRKDLAMIAEYCKIPKDIYITEFMHNAFYSSYYLKNLDRILLYNKVVLKQNYTTLEKVLYMLVDNNSYPLSYADQRYEKKHIFTAKEKVQYAIDKVREGYLMELNNNTDAWINRSSISYLRTITNRCNAHEQRIASIMMKFNSNVIMVFKTFHDANDMDTLIPMHTNYQEITAFLHRLVDTIHSLNRSLTGDEIVYISDVIDQLINTNKVPEDSKHFVTSELQPKVLSIKDQWLDYNPNEKDYTEFWKN